MTVLNTHEERLAHLEITRWTANKRNAKDLWKMGFSLQRQDHFSSEHIYYALRAYRNCVSDMFVL